jgi:mannose-6-phosphate isomerase-like protein (cupin superfamily)
MRKVNTRDVAEESWTSPKGKFGGHSREISVALGREPRSTDLKKRHPFDLEILRMSPGQTPYPYHSHSAQWEFYVVIAGTGAVRDAEGTTPIEAGDAFVFEPGQPHQFTNTGSDDLIVHVIADNPFGESWHYPDSEKWGVASPNRTLLSTGPKDYYEGEE